MSIADRRPRAQDLRADGRDIAAGGLRDRAHLGLIADRQGADRASTETPRLNCKHLNRRLNPHSDMRSAARRRAIEVTIRPASLYLSALRHEGGPGTVRGVQCSRLTLRIPTTFIES
jgi:hypothetical protein